MASVGQILELQFNANISAKSRGFYWFLLYDPQYFEPVDIDSVAEGYQFDVIQLYQNTNILAPNVKFVENGKIGCTISVDFAGVPMNTGSYELFRFKGLKALKEGTTQIRYNKFTVLDENGNAGNIPSTESGGPSTTIDKLQLSTLEIKIRN